MRKQGNYTIIGNSAAALSAVRAIRKMGDWSPIVLISDEPCNAYSPVLTTYYIAGRIKKSELFVVNSGFYRKFKVKVLLGHKAVAIDADEQQVHLDNGAKVPFEKLLIATGASARTLHNVEQDARDYVLTLRTIDDAERIIKFAKEAKEIVLVGGGLVSLQTLSAVFDENKSFTVLEVADQILPQQLDRVAASIIMRRIEHKGVRVLLGRGVDRIIKRDGRAVVITTYGESLAADMVISGIGVVPNVEVAKGIGLEIRSGIVVNNYMQTNIKNIFAAGDVTESTNTITGYSETIATWPNACAQGEVAGMNMAGSWIEIELQCRENITAIMGIPAAVIGSTRHQGWNGGELCYFDEKRNIYRKLLMDGPYVIGAILLGRIEDAGVIRYCISKRIDTSTWGKKLVRGLLSFGNTFFSNYFSWPVEQMDRESI